MKQNDLFADAFGAPRLDDAFVDRVRRLALSELAPSASEAAGPLSRTVGGLLIPALLMSAAVVRTTETLRAAGEIFAPDETQRD